LAAKKKKKMNTVQLSIELSFEQLVAIVKQLSPKELQRLNDIVWGDGEEIPDEHIKLTMQRIKKAKKDPSRLIPWDEAVKKLRAHI
jgi:hypothetical protein